MILQWIVWVAGMLILGGLAQFYRVRAEALASALTDNYEWIDEIIAALEDPQEDRSDERLDRLVSERSSDGRAVHPER